MLEREELIELLSRYFQIGDSYAYNLTRVKTAFEVGTMSLEDFEEFDEETVADIADHLIDHGIIVPPCKVGDVVYSLSGEGIFRQIVKFIETDKHSQIRLRCECDLDCNKCPHMGCWNEYRYRAYGLDDIGKTVFLTREEAEAALAERRKA